MTTRTITGITKGREPYVCGAKDPRKIPLSRCVSLGDLMATLERCKELDKLDKENENAKKEEN